MKPRISFNSLLVLWGSPIVMYTWPLNQWNGVMIEPIFFFLALHERSNLTKILKWDWNIEVKFYKNFFIYTSLVLNKSCWRMGSQGLRCAECASHNSTDKTNFHAGRKKSQVTALVVEASVWITANLGGVTPTLRVEDFCLI